ncbi:2-hydroxyacid dehydrogenase [Crateriforma conspicua]|uniref:2-hydroxyacid dehydrogenase n=1 Tax=Crateriforma conspicua TaxID=2527996 RepID=UPI00118944AB|nr:2-hydroxyacid dehydrogenase [Crateriforma conspicua]QDV64392.1 D-lactate dehydrogenase [Crateriforma conspicua]
MKVACFSTKSYDRQFIDEALESRDADLPQHEFRFLKPDLNRDTVVLADESDAICAFVNDRLDREVLEALKVAGIRFLVMRCAGFNNIDLKAAADFGIRAARVPKYSPYAVAEHAIGLLLTLNRKIHRAYHRVRDNNFSLEGLIGFDLHGRTVGIVGTGEIGKVFTRIASGFGCRCLMYDVHTDPAMESLGEYVSMERLLAESDIVSLHCPLNPHTYHLIDADALQTMKPGAIVVNTSRGGLVDAAAAIKCLKSGHLGGLALDVYEEESGLFFNDLSSQIIQDDVLTRLMTFPNVLITAHQAFFTSDAMRSIAMTTLTNLDCFESGQAVENEIVDRSE